MVTAQLMSHILKANFVTNLKNRKKSILSLDKQSCLELVDQLQVLHSNNYLTIWKDHETYKWKGMFLLSLKF